MRHVLASAMLGCLASTAFAQPGAPLKTHEPGVTIELFAEHPQIVTPTGIEVDRHCNQLYFGSDTPAPEGQHGGSTMFSAVAVIGGFRGRYCGEVQPGVAMSVRTNDEHPDVTRALIDTLREVADQLEKALASS